MYLCTDHYPQITTENLFNNFMYDSYIHFVIDMVVTNGLNQSGSTVTKAQRKYKSCDRHIYKNPMKPEGDDISALKLLLYIFSYLQ